MRVSGGFAQRFAGHIRRRCRPDRRWWAVYTKSRQEKALARHLIGHQVPFYLPLIPKDNIIRSRRVRSHVPLFSGYIFLFGSEEERVTTLTTNRISRILPVADQDQLRRDLANVHGLIDRNAPLAVEQRLTPGDPVRIKSGLAARPGRRCGQTARQDALARGREVPPAGRFGRNRRLCTRVPLR